MPTQEILNQLLTFVSLHQHANNQPNSQICSVDTVDLQILQSDWLRAFWPSLRNKIFPKYGTSAETQLIISIAIIE